MTNTRRRYIASSVFVASARALLEGGESTNKTSTHALCRIGSVPAHHDVCVCAGYGKREPQAESLEEALPVGADEIAHNTTIETRNGDAEHGSEDEEGCVGEEYEGLFGAVGREGNT